MAIESLSPINSVVDVSRFSGMDSGTSHVGSPNNFFQLINEKLESVDSSIKKSDGLVASYMKGEDIPVHEIMVALGKAKTEIQLAVEIRNKLLESYQEITRIQL